MNTATLNVPLSHVPVKRTQEVFVVWTNTDLTEGRGQEYARNYCELEATANRIAKGNYVMGSDCDVTKETLLVIGDKTYYPGGIITKPTEEDKRTETRLVEERVKAEKKAAAILKAKTLGLSEEDILALKA